MMRAVPILIAGLSLLVEGCYVASVHPLHRPGEVVFDADLIGTWADPQAPDERLTFASQGDTAYSIRVEDSDGVATYTGYLVELGRSTFLDVSPADDRHRACGDGFAPVHIVHRIHRSGDELRAAFIDAEWAKGRRNGRQLDIPHRIEGGEILLTADTEALRRFVTGALEEEGVFAEYAPFLRVE